MKGYGAQADVACRPGVDVAVSIFEQQLACCINATVDAATIALGMAEADALSVIQVKLTPTGGIVGARSRVSGTPM